MDTTTRSYLTWLADGTWQITAQALLVGVWTTQSTYGTYPTWQEALATNLDPLAYDPTPDWPVALGGQDGTI